MHPDIRWKIETDNFGNLSDPKKCHIFQTSGLYDVYCKSCEMTGGIEVHSDALSIPVRVWMRPTVDNTPPQSAINNGLVSWRDGKYCGIKGEPVYLMATGTKGSAEPEEEITKFLWDFDNNWNTVEVEQPAGERVSHIWDSSNLNGSIRCKAVTNYGVKSDEKVFDLKIYDVLKVDTQGPYTGKPNKAVDLDCSVNQTAYPGANFEYQWRVSTETTFTLKGVAQEKGTYVDETQATGTAILKNSATELSDTYTLKNDATEETGYIQLTPNINGKNGQMEYAGLHLGNNWAVEGEFWSGGGNGADAFYIYAYANETPLSEYDNKGQYSINYDEYQDEIQLMYGTQTLATLTQTNFDNSSWRQFKVECNSGVFKIYLDGQLKLEYDDSANYATRTTNNLFGFGARTGGATNYHRVRNMKWSCGTATDTDSNGKTQYTWTKDGEYRIEAEAIVTTAEGLVLIDIADTRATIQAGKPTAMPGGPYRGGIKGGNYSPIQFEGNHPDFVESSEVGKIVEWEWTLGNEQIGTIWNPTHHFEKAGQYEVSLKVKSEYGKWSYPQTADVKVIDGKIAGYVRAADLRTPVGSVTLTLTSSHVDKDVLAKIATEDSRLTTTGDGGLQTLTDNKGYYEFAHIPMDNYHIWSIQHRVSTRNEGQRRAYLGTNRLYRSTKHRADPLLGRINKGRFRYHHPLHKKEG